LVLTPPKDGKLRVWDRHLILTVTCDNSDLATRSGPVSPLVLNADRDPTSSRPSFSNSPEMAI
jgi:hypothetical protein